MLGRSSHLGVNRTQIDVPAPLAYVVGVADGISELRPLAADITNSCHNSTIPSRPVAETSILQEFSQFSQARRVARAFLPACRVRPYKSPQDFPSRRAKFRHHPNSGEFLRPPCPSPAGSNGCNAEHQSESRSNIPDTFWSSDPPAQDPSASVQSGH